MALQSPTVTECLSISSVLSIYCFYYWRRQWQPTHILWESYERRSLLGCSTWGVTAGVGHTTERFHFHFSLSVLFDINGNPIPVFFSLHLYRDSVGAACPLESDTISDLKAVQQYVFQRFHSIILVRFCYTLLFLFPFTAWCINSIWFRTCKKF